MPRSLTRDTRRSVLGGVAAGFGSYLDVDPVFVRLGFVLLALANGIGVLFYLVCWLAMPAMAAAGATAPGAPGIEALRSAGERLADEVRAAAPDPASAQLAVGTVLVVVGAALLGHNLDWFHWPWWLRFSTLWPLLLVALGVGLIAKSRRATAA